MIYFVRKLILIMFTILLVGLASGTLFAQGKGPKGKSFYVSFAIPTFGYFQAPVNGSTGSTSFLHRGLEFGASLGIDYHFGKWVSLGIGAVGNYSVALNGTISSNLDSISVSGGWNLGAYSTLTILPKFIIKPYLKFEIGYDYTELVGLSSSLNLNNVQLSGVRYTLLGGISLGSGITRFYVEGGLFAKTNTGANGKSLNSAEIQKTLKSAFSNVQESTGYLVNIGFQYQFGLF